MQVSEASEPAHSGEVGVQVVHSQVVADALGLRPQDIRVITDVDTAKDAWSIAAGNYSSRFAGAVAGAAHLAAIRMRDKLARIAASQLNVGPDQVRHEIANKIENAQAPDEPAVRRADDYCIAAELAAEHDATMVYISTGGVFDGTKEEGYYTEADKPNPIMVYGATKLTGEVHTRALVPKHYILRPGWMVGGGPRNDHKFVKMIVDAIGNVGAAICIYQSTSLPPK